MPIPGQAPAVGDRLELECSSIAFGGQVKYCQAFLRATPIGDSAVHTWHWCAPCISDCGAEGEPGALDSSCLRGFAGRLQAAQRLHSVL